MKEKETKSATDSMASYKSPGPDGFPMEVYKRGWEFMKLEIMAVVRIFRVSVF